MSVSVVEVDNAQKIVKEEKLEQSSSIVKAKKGDTLESILRSQDLAQSEIVQIISLIKEKNEKYLLKIGDKITFNYELQLTETDNDDLTSESQILTGIKIAVDKLHAIEIIKSGDNFTIQNTTIPVNKFVTKYTEIINTNLIATLKSIGVPASNIAELINAYSNQIDFQRQIHPGDTVTVIMEKFTTQDGSFAHHGKILFASLILSGKQHNIYNYSYNNVSRFFSEDGKGVKRNLLKTPVNILRISSAYGIRKKHPIDGYTKMHRGIDFAAPEGTPIYAAGDGVITELGIKSGYGKFIQIKHSPTLSTAYAHAKAFAKDLKVGSCVKQGRIIAYVGRTGNTTGAHLHYEVKIDGKQVNPMSIKTTPGIELTGSNLKKFQQFKSNINNLNTTLDTKVDVAENEIGSIR